MRFRAAVACALVAALLVATAGYAQRRFGGRQRFVPPGALATNDSFDGSWHFCRLAYSGGAWSTDYPDADYNFSTRLSELTKTTVSRTPAGEVRPLIVRPTDDALFQCGFVMLWQAESLFFSEEDAARIRQYLLKGGFLWSDDSWGTYAWQNFEYEMRKVLPEAKYTFADLTRSHLMYRSFFELPRVPQIPAISHWRRSGGDTSERGLESAVPDIKAINDRHGRIIVLMTHDTDISDSWEREGEDPAFFYQFSPNGYALGINVLLHAMTH